MPTTAHRRGAPLAAGLVAGALLLAACAAGSDGTSMADPAPGTTAATPAGQPVPGASEAARPDPAPRVEELREMSDEELAAETYVAGYPLVVSTRTMQRLGGLLGVNRLFWQSSLSGPDSRVIVAPNRDTLYSISVLDLRGGPLVLRLPEVADRYYTYQFLSPWTDSFAYLGTRATDGRAGTWVIAPPGWTGTVPEGADVIESPTPQVFLLGRFLVDDDADVAEVLAIRDRSSLVPLAGLDGSDPGPAVPPLGAPAGTAQDIPTDAAFYDELATTLAVNPPPTEYQRALFAEARARLGVGGPADDPAAAARRVALDSGAAAGSARIADEVAQRAEIVDGWSVNTDIGTYGDDLALRAFVARVGWGANVPDEAVYPVARVDGDGSSLDGSGGRTYTITFPAGEVPPLDELGFWSLSAYGSDLFFTPHPSGRYTVGDRTPGLSPGPDGSLTITLAHAEPPGGVANWLPVPDGPFVLMLRLYLPGDAVLDRTWTPPPVVPAGG